MALTRTNGGASPFQATGRALSMFTVSLANVHVSYDAPESDFEKLIRAIETVSSIEILGTPGSGSFRVAVSGTSLNAAQVEAILAAAVATTTVASYTF
jgi:hypothetical protein